MFHGQICEFTNHCIWFFSCRNESIFGIAIQKDVQLCVWFEIAGDIAPWKKDLAKLFAIEIETRICFACDAEEISFAEVCHGCRLGERQIGVDFSIPAPNDRRSKGEKSNEQCCASRNSRRSRSKSHSFARGILEDDFRLSRRGISQCCRKRMEAQDVSWRSH